MERYEVVSTYRVKSSFYPRDYIFAFKYFILPLISAP